MLTITAVAALNTIGDAYSRLNSAWEDLPFVYRWLFLLLVMAFCALIRQTCFSRSDDEQ